MPRKLLTAVLLLASLINASYAAPAASDAAFWFGLSACTGAAGGMISWLVSDDPEAPGHPRSAVALLKQIAVSAIAAGIFAPSAMRYLALAGEYSYSIAVAGGIGIVAPFLLLAVRSIAQSVAADPLGVLHQWFPRLFPAPPDPPSRPKPDAQK